MISIYNDKIFIKYIFKEKIIIFETLSNKDINICNLQIEPINQIDSFLRYKYL
jgi:hypothetical protein